MIQVEKFQRTVAIEIVVRQIWYPEHEITLDKPVQWEGIMGVARKGQKLEDITDLL